MPRSTASAQRSQEDAKFFQRSGPSRPARGSHVFPFPYCTICSFTLQFPSLSTNIVVQRQGLPKSLCAFSHFDQSSLISKASPSMTCPRVILVHESNTSFPGHFATVYRVNSMRRNVLCRLVQPPCAPSTVPRIPMTIAMHNPEPPTLCNCAADSALQDLNSIPNVLTRCCRFM